MGLNTCKGGPKEGALEAHSPVQSPDGEANLLPFLQGTVKIPLCWQGGLRIRQPRCCSHCQCQGQARPSQCQDSGEQYYLHHSVKELI